MQCIKQLGSYLFILTLLMSVGGILDTRPCRGESITATGSMITARDDHSATLLQNGKVLVAGGYNGNALAGAELYDPTAGNFSATGNMTAPRALHTATLLPNGKVLIVGGYDTVDALPLFGAELYDPATGAFTATGNLTTARYRHTATLLPNGKVLIVGGEDASNQPVADAELYDPATGTFTAAGNLTTGRYGHTATLLQNGKVLITGGGTRDTLLASAELYDPAAAAGAGAFSVTGSMTTPHSGHSATLLPNGKLLVAGGWDIYSSYLTVAELYDPATGTFAATGSMTTAREGHAATLLPNGKVLIAGGYHDGSIASTELYDPTAGTFTASSSLMTSRFVHTATLLPNGKVLIAGGDHTDPGDHFLASAELYDPAAPRFTTTGNLTTARSGHTATILTNSKVLVAGGIGASGATLAGAELYVPASGSFTASGSMTTPRNGHSATLLPSGKVLIAGGVSGSGAPLAAAELYDPATGAFTATGSMAAVRHLHTATLLANGKVLIAGGIGSDGSLVLAGAELYDPVTGTFAATGGMSVARDCHSAILLPSGKVLVTGGYNNSGTPLAGAELYDPAAGAFTTTGAMTAARAKGTAMLLPNGNVLIAGGMGSVGSLAGAELYDPAAGVFTPTGSMLYPRVSPAAALLADGTVLVTGGAEDGTALAGAELYDPGLALFGATGSMSASRDTHSATLLPNGKVLVAGGYSAGSYLAGAELYDPGLGLDDSLRPTVSSIVTASGTPPHLTVTGSGFRGVSEGSGGTVNGSATNYPLLLLQRVDNDRMSFIPPDPSAGWSDTAFGSVSVSGLPHGIYRATIFTNAVPSLQQFVTVGPVSSVSPTTWDFGKITTGTTSPPGTFTITNNGANDLIVNAATTADSQFSVGPGSCGKPPASVAPAASCTITATFSPTAAGDSSSTLTIRSNDPATPATSIKLTGSGVLPLYPLTVTFAGTGAGTAAGTTTGAPKDLSYPASGSISITSGADATLTPKALANSYFVSWTGCDSTNDNQCTVKMSGARNLTATFNLLTVPGAPKNVTATAGVNRATVSFTPPDADGHATISGYTVTSQPGGFTATGTSSPLTVSELTNGTAYTFTVKAVNSVGAGTPSAPSNSVIPFDAVVINNGNLYTSKTAVTVTLHYPDAAYMKFSIFNGVWTSWMPYAGKSFLTLPSGDGPKIVSYYFKDGTGQIYGPYSATITLDTKKPKGTISINDGAAYTNTRSVTLSLTASDATTTVASMQFSPDRKNWSGWETFRTTKPYDLPDGDGPKTVYVHYKDDAGLVSAPCKAGIILDTTPPVGTIRINGGKATTRSSTVALTLKAKGAAQMQLSNDGTSWNDWQAYSTRIRAWDLTPGSGPRTVHVRFKDPAGNISIPYKSSITVQ